MSEYVVAQASVLIVPTLGKPPDDFRSKLERDLARQRHSLKVEIEASKASLVKMRAEVNAAKKAAEATPINLRINSLGITKQITEIRHKYLDAAREMRKGLMLNIKIAGLTLIPQLATGLAAVNSAMMELVHSAALIPGIFAGVASSVASLLTGMSGVKDAFREYSEAQKNAASEGQKSRNAAINVQNAYRDLGRAIKDTKRNLEDLNAQLRDAPLDEAEAIIRLQEARAEAADKYQKSGLQQQKDAIAVQRAENDLINTRMRNSRLVQDVAEANAKGVAGADSVREATERLSKAQDDASTKAEKLIDSFKQLSPNAQAFVKAVTDMRETWTGFKNSVQDRLFAGVDQEFTRFAQTTIPTLQKGLGAIADGLNSNLKAAMDSVGSPDNQGFLERIFGNTAVAQKNISNAIDPFVDAMMRLSAVGTNFLPRLADGLTELMKRFDNFTSRVDRSGELNDWIENGIDALNDIGNTMINLGSILNSVHEAFVGTGGEGLFDILEQSTKKLADFLNSTDGQNQMQDFFREVREQLSMWEPLLDSLPDLISNVTDAAQDWAELLLPFLQTAAGLLADQPWLVQSIFTAYLAWNGIRPILKGVAGGIDAAKKAVDFFKGSTDKAGNAVESGFKRKMTSLADFLGKGGGFYLAATAAAAFLTYNLVAAHDEAANAAQRQKQQLEDLTTSLDKATGAATNFTNAEIAKKLREGVNDPQRRIPNLINQVDPAQQNNFINAISSGNVDAALAFLPKGATAQVVENTDFWKEHGKAFTDNGVDSATVAKALNGEPEAVKKYEDALDKINWGPLAGKIPNIITRTLETTGFGGDSPDLLDLRNQLPADVQAQAEARGAVQSLSGDINAGGAAVRQDSKAGQGRIRLRPDNPFGPLGVVTQSDGGQVYLSPDGSGATMQTTQQPTGALKDQLDKEGVRIEKAPNGFLLILPPEAADKFTERYAAGGLIRGPGSGTSDSIMARLSSGEYVVNARSTQKHLPLLERINSGDAPGFSVGGMVGGNLFPLAPPTPAPPAPPAPPVDGGLTVASLGKISAPPTSTTVGGGLAGNRSSGVAKPVDTTTTSWAPLINSLRAGLGLSAPGYGETGITLPVNKPKIVDNPFGPTGLGSGNYMGMGPFPSSGPTPEPRPGVQPYLDEYLPMINGDKGVMEPKPGEGLPPFGTAPTTPTATPKPAAPTSTSTPTPTPTPPTPTGNRPKIPPYRKYNEGEPGFYDPVTGELVQGPNLNPSNPYAPLDYGSSGSTSAPKPPPVSLPTPPTPPASSGGSAPVPHGGTAGVPVSAGPGNAPVVSAPAPVVSGATQNLQQVTGLPAPVIRQGLQNPVAGPAIAQIAYEGLPVGTNIPYGEAGFPAWVYQTGSEWGVSASTYPGHQEGSGANKGIDWVPTGVDAMTPEGAQRLTDFAKYLASTGQVEQVIYENPFTGERVGVADGRLVGPGTDRPNHYMADWANHRNHIHTRTSLAFPSPSNMPMAMTPTGVQLPQLTYGNNGQSADGEGGGDPAANWFKYVSESWTEILNNLVKNAGQIALNMVGSFFGVDLSPILGTTNAIISGVGEADKAMKGEGGSGDGSGSGANLPGNEDVSTILGGLDGLPPEYANQYNQYSPDGGAEQWRPVVREILKQVAPRYGITNLKAWEDDIVGQIGLESGGNPYAANLNDTDGKGGTQQVFGLGQFLQSTFDNHNVIGGSINDPIAQIYAMIDYLASDRYGVIPGGGVNWKGYGWRNGKGYATGGMVPMAPSFEPIDPINWIDTMNGGKDIGGGVLYPGVRPFIGASGALHPSDPFENAAGGLIGYADGGLVGDGWWNNDDFMDSVADEWGVDGGISYNRNGGLIRSGGQGDEPPQPWERFNPPVPNPANLYPADPMALMGFNYPNPAAMRNATGGRISGPGSGKSDSILARVSNGEYVVRAPMAQKHLGLLEAINSNRLPGFADGGPGPGLWPVPPPPPVAPPAPTPPAVPAPAPAPVAPAPPGPPAVEPQAVGPVPGAPADPAGPRDAAAEGVPSAPDAPKTPEEVAAEVAGQLGGAMGAAGAGTSSPGAEAPAGGDPAGDPRAAMGAAPQNLDHTKPAISQGIQSAAGVISSAIGSAMTAASMAANASSPGSGQAMGAASSAVQGIVQAASGAVTGAVNILSSLGVGTVTPSQSTSGAYGAPMTRQGMGQEFFRGPQVVNNWNGGVHTSNDHEFYRIQQRRELQMSSSFLPNK